MNFKLKTWNASTELSASIPVLMEKWALLAQAVENQFQEERKCGVFNFAWNDDLYWKYNDLGKEACAKKYKLAELRSDLQIYWDISLIGDDSSPYLMARPAVSDKFLDLSNDYPGELEVHESVQALRSRVFNIRNPQPDQLAKKILGYFRTGRL